jgi:hypothetical protein
MRTILLDSVLWDMVIDASGNIAVADVPYAMAQDAASAIKTFLGEAYYDTTLGVPYLTNSNAAAATSSPLMGGAVNLPALKAALVSAAETVPGVAAAQVFITSVRNRVVSGQVQVTDSDGNTQAANF